MTKKIAKYQRDVLKALSGKADDFYLAGGTALSLFYFQHRASFDLDLFTNSFDYTRIAAVVRHLEESLKRKIELIGQNLSKRTAQMAVYNIYFTAKNALKIDFVEDVVKLLKETKVVDGIRVLSLEDIYMRKLYALSGMVKTADEAGRDKFVGGRADAKDFYDVYCLSHTFMPLSKFMSLYCNRTMREAVIRWFRTYDRIAMMDGILDLATHKPIDYREEERHLKTEVTKIIDLELGGL